MILSAIFVAASILSSESFSLDHKHIFGARKNVYSQKEKSPRDPFSTKLNNDNNDIAIEITSETAETPEEESFYKRNGIIPITMISGFLGSGKTTLLQNLLHNNQGLKVAIIVNDVASVNIDSKLITGNATSSTEDIIELSNGCACCSLSDELLASVSELITISDLRADDEKFDHIIVELSGVSDPKLARGKFQEAIMYGMPLMERTQLDTMITVVDCGTYMNHLKSTKDATPDDTPELFYRNEEERIEEEKQWESVPDDLRELLGGAKPSAGFKESSSAVVDLLVTQTEAADIVILNKVDQVEDENIIKQVRSVVSTLNPSANVLETVFGKVDDPSNILGSMDGNGVAASGVVDDHKDLVKVVKENREKKENEELGHSHTDSHSNESHDDDHSHSHSHAHEEESHDDNIHSHSHGHDHEKESHDESHSHSHSHAHEKESLNDSHSHSHVHADESHSHSHSHSHAHDSSDHSHSHSHSHDDEFHYSAIQSFVYSARRPFHPQRLYRKMLSNLPITRGLNSDSTTTVDEKEEKDIKELFSCLLRSKGFCWLANSNIAALYWSHAGTSFEMQCLGRWWATLPREQWPDESVSTILSDFDSPDHTEGNDEESNDTSILETSVGDRRIEVVMIGTFPSSDVEKKMAAVLDECLLTDEEWAVFKKNCHDEQALNEIYPNDIDLQMVTF